MPSRLPKKQTKNNWRMNMKKKSCSTFTLYTFVSSFVFENSQEKMKFLFFVHFKTAYHQHIILLLIFWGACFQLTKQEKKMYINFHSSF